jgi:hypothetical protein
VAAELTGKPVALGGLPGGLSREGPPGKASVPVYVLARMPLSAPPSTVGHGRTADDYC